MRAWSWLYTTMKKRKHITTYSNHAVKKEGERKRKIYHLSQLNSCLNSSSLPFLILMVSKTYFATFSSHHVLLKNCVNSFPQPHVHLLLDSNQLFCSSNHLHHIQLAAHCLPT